MKNEEWEREHKQLLYAYTIPIQSDLSILAPGNKAVRFLMILKKIEAMRACTESTRSSAVHESRRQADLAIGLWSSQSD